LGDAEEDAVFRLHARLRALAHGQRLAESADLVPTADVDLRDGPERPAGGQREGGVDERVRVVRGGPGLEADPQRVVLLAQALDEGWRMVAVAVEGREEPGLAGEGGALGP